MLNLRFFGILSVVVFSSYAITDNQPPIGTSPPEYTSAQAQQGEVIYKRSCTACHGINLNDGGFGPPLVGDLFYGMWGGRIIDQLFQYIKEKMPLGAPGSLTEKETLELIAYLLKKQGIAASAQPLAAGVQRNMIQRLPMPAGGLVSKEVISIPPDPNPPSNPLEGITAVTDEMLSNPPANDWLMWRRTFDAQGYSPLKNITQKNVKNLKFTWSWTLPKGRNIATPLVHDGVMFMHSVGSQIYAFNAITGDLLWRYQDTSQGVAPRINGPRAMSIYQHSIILTSDDGRIVALDVKTGKKIWDKAVLEDPKLWLSAGTLVAKGKVIVGTTAAPNSGKNFIVALDANTGEEQWRFYTLEEDRGLKDSWNGTPAEDRNGAGVYVPGSYDPKTNLVFFGTANNYNPKALRNLKKGASGNGGLYTNTTLALDVDTGQLAWHFQHLPNDQWNYDWAFERTITTVRKNGRSQKILLGSGKEAVFDGLNIENGHYAFSVDLGLQNVIQSIDPTTGAKTINPEVIPNGKKTLFVCPDSYGARTWRPTALDGDVLYVPFRETCMKMRPPLPGDLVNGQFDLGQRYYPRPDSDGNFGGIQAVDLKTGKTLWTHRKRNVPNTGILATAGGLVFSGSIDRVFSAYSSKDGEELWQARLNGVPSAAPISFRVDGKQYIAVIAGGSGQKSSFFVERTVVNPESVNATIWVFEEGVK